MIESLNTGRINSFSYSPVRIKINVNKLPRDFFKKTNYFRKNSLEKKTKINQNPTTPNFGRKKCLP
jgi:hypothetical protein